MSSEIMEDVRSVRRQGTRRHDAFPVYVLIEPEAWEAAQRIADYMESRRTIWQRIRQRIRQHFGKMTSELQYDGPRG